MNIRFKFYSSNRNIFFISASHLLRNVRMDLISMILILNILLTFNANHYVCNVLNSHINHRIRRSHHSVRPSDYYKIKYHSYPSAYLYGLQNDEIPSSFLFNKNSLLGDLKRDYSNEILTNEILATREKASQKIDFDATLSQKEKQYIKDAIQKRLIDRLKNIYLIKTRSR
jgi:hypothetical protein